MMCHMSIVPKSKATLYILCGLPFAGKTTLANSLMRAHQWQIVSIDELSSKLGIGTKGEATGPREWEIINSASYHETELHLSTGRTVIYDGPNFTYTMRQALRNIAQKTKHQAVVIYVATDVQEVTVRWQANRRSKVRKDVRDEDFFRVIENFEEPKEDEQAILYMNGQEINKVIATPINIL